MVNKEEPIIVFLMETKSSREWMKKVKERCKMKHGLIVPSNGSRGGMAMLWKEGVKLDVQTYLDDHIDAWVDGGVEVGWWHLTGFYGNPKIAKRPESWAKLKQLNNTSSLPWVVIGDFNEITGLSEKKGGSMRPRRQMEIFVEAINHCGLREVNYIGPRFTWIYQLKDGEQIRERLDRALATQEWMDLFPTAKLHHLSSSASDHSLLCLHLVHRQRRRKARKLFIFESMWLKDRRCEEVVKAAWVEKEMVATNRVLERCLERCRVDLSAWNKSEFGHVGRKISNLQRRLEGLELLPASTEQIRELKSTRIELNC